MAYRQLMVMRMDPAHAGEVAQIFAEHDETDLPRRIGATGRSLFRFHNLYMHLIEADEDFMERLYDFRSHPIFKETNERLARYLRPYGPGWTELKDSQAQLFYTRRWGREDD